MVFACSHRRPSAGDQLGHAPREQAVVLSSALPEARGPLPLRGCQLRLQVAYELVHAFVASLPRGGHRVKAFGQSRQALDPEIPAGRELAFDDDQGYDVKTSKSRVTIDVGGQAQVGCASSSAAPWTMLGLPALALLWRRRRR